jgi:hypothetical protein
LEVNTNKIVDFVLLQKKIVTGDLEKQACNMVLGRLIEDNVSVKMLVTDRHRGIGLLMRTNYKDIVHEYDVWHLAKSLAKKIKVYEKKYEVIGAWKCSIINHLWWCAESCEGSGELLIEKFTSILYHITNH